MLIYSAMVEAGAGKAGQLAPLVGELRKVLTTDTGAEAVDGHHWGQMAGGKIRQAVGWSTKIMQHVTDLTGVGGMGRHFRDWPNVPDRMDVRVRHPRTPR